MGLAKFLPISGAAPNGRITYGLPTVQNLDEYITRFDQVVRGQDKFFLRFYLDRYVHKPGYDGKNLLTDVPGSTVQTQNWATGYTWVEGPAGLHRHRPEQQHRDVRLQRPSSEFQKRPGGGGGPLKNLTSLANYTLSKDMEIALASTAASLMWAPAKAPACRSAVPTWATSKPGQLLGWTAPIASCSRLSGTSRS